jgi:tetratricopeptide (TPR) repeat protein
MMNIKWLRILMLITCTFGVGCSALLKSPNGPAVSPAFSARTDNAYFLFISAQLDKNSGQLADAADKLKQALELDPQSIYLKRELATVMVMNKQAADALALLRQILQDHPLDRESLLLMGRIYHQLDQKDEAIEVFEKLIDAYPQEENVYLILGNMYQDRSRWKAAIRTYRKMVDNFPDMFSGYYFLGQSYAKNGQVQAARKAFEKCLSLDPNLIEPRLALIALFRDNRDNQNNDQQIIRLYRDILEREPANIQASAGLGLFYYERGDEAAAGRIFNQLGRRSIQDPTVFQYVATLCFEKKQFRQATILLEGMLTGASENADMHYLLGICYDELNQPNKALEQLEKVSPESRFYENAVIAAAFIFQKIGNVQAGIDYLQAAVDQQRQSPELLFYLGSFYEERDDMPAAATTYEAGLSADPKSGRIKFRLAVVYDKLQRRDDSIALMSQVVKDEPQNASALNYLGYTYADMGIELDRAEELIKAALKIKPEDGYIVDSLGWVYFKQGKFELAQNVLKRAAELVPDDPVILEHLGDAYERNGATRQALESYRQALEKKIDDNQRQSLMRKIDQLEAQLR